MRLPFLACTRIYRVDVQTEKRQAHVAMFIWITARTIHPGMEDEFRKAWQSFLEAGSIPGLIEVQYAWQPENPRKVLGISYWESRSDCESYRASQIEGERLRRLNAMVESIDFSTYYESETIPLP